MEYLKAFHDFFYFKLGLGLAFYYAIGFAAVIGLLAQWRLYEKCNQPGLAAFVPIWNVIIFMRIVGRPDRDAWKILIPIYGQLWFVPMVWIEICKCFGKRSILDYVLVILLNGLYILNLALGEDNRYMGPLRGQAPLPPPHKLTSSRPQLA
ncbi:MAG: hypothetical protein IPL52_13165 [Flavobacteriales bacterium]|nr:hypothetical protein [Flavobacteriales bacterium]